MMDHITQERFDSAVVFSTRAAAVASCCKAIMFTCIGAAFLAAAAVLAGAI